MATSFKDLFGHSLKGDRPKTGHKKLFDQGDESKSVMSADYKRRILSW